MKQRLQWIDAMRGFTMLMVVTNHVQSASFGELPNLSSSMQFFLLFRMPMFFFISGFLAYRTKDTWTFHDFCQKTGKKLRVQIIPTIVFFLVGAILLHPSTFGSTVVDWYHSPRKGGYWFTLVLLYMFVVYYVFEFIENNIVKYSLPQRAEEQKSPKLWPILTLWVIAVFGGLTCYLPKWFSWGQRYGYTYTGWLNDTSVIELLRYFHFFIFGNIVHRYWHKFERLFDLKGFYLAIVALAFLSTVEYVKLHFLRGQWANLTHMMAQYSLLTIVFLFFRYYQDSFTQDRRLGRLLQYVGMRTLDVYLIHYLFLPKVPAVGKFFNANPGNFVLDTALSLGVSILIVGFCVVVSNTLRISPFLKKYLFGRG